MKVVDSIFEHLLMVESLKEAIKPHPPPHGLRAELWRNGGASWMENSRVAIDLPALASRQLAGWLASFIHFAINLLLSWFRKVKWKKIN